MEDKGVNLELELGSTNYHLLTNLNNSSGAGAGASAGSRVYVAFTECDPLSELVWSPINGLSLKRANSDKKSFLWNIEPNWKGTRVDTAVDQGQLAMSQGVLDADGTFYNKFTSVIASTKCPIPVVGSSGDRSNENCNTTLEVKAVTNCAALKDQNHRDGGKEDLCSLQNGQVPNISELAKALLVRLSTLAVETGECTARTSVNRLFPTRFIRKASGNQKIDVEFNASKRSIVGLDGVDHCEPLGTSSDVHLESWMKQSGEGNSATGKMSKMKINMTFPIAAAPLTKLESSAEKNMSQLAVNDACNLAETELMTKNFTPIEGPPKNSQICLYQKKGKAKALSDGKIHGRNLNDVDDDCESVESRNSAEQFAEGLKRHSYNLELIVGTKRIKRDYVNPGLASFVIPDSSFTNWVSNMVKGMSVVNKEDSLPQALALTCPNGVCSKNPEESFMCNKRHESPSLNMGLQTVFQSLYCENMNTAGIGGQNSNECNESSGDSLGKRKKSLENMIPSCHRKGDKGLTPNNTDQSSKSWILSCKLVENKASGILACNREENRAIQSDLDGKQMDRAADKISPNIQLAKNDLDVKKNPEMSIWITRLQTRLEKCKEIAQKTDKCSIYLPEMNLDDRLIDDVAIDQKKSSGNNFSDCQIYACEKWIQRFTANSELLFDPKSMSKQHDKTPVEKYRSSEAMASTFARRLDALRHIIPSKRKQSSMYSITCLFCGSDHYLSECPNVTENELKDLLVKTSSVDRVEESACLCIRCFQSDHWAISCPLAPPSGHCGPEPKASLISHYTAFHLQVCDSHGRHSSYCREEEGCKLVATDQTTWNLDNSLSKQVFASKKIQTTTAMTISERDTQNHLPCNIVSETNMAAPLEICHAIKNLRLSRGDILRWMNSSVSLSHLNGFFLRLRLGKLESGPGESRYYVACITGNAQEHNTCKSKKSILVDVGGIKSSVKSQFVSNHDFIEDEINAWWCRTLKSGRRIPSLNELNSKFNDRRSLGF